MENRSSFAASDLAIELKATAGDQFPEIMVIATATATGPCIVTVVTIAETMAIAIVEGEASKLSAQQ